MAVEIGNRLPGLTAPLAAAGVEDLAHAMRAETGESGDGVYGCVANQHTLLQAVKIALKGDGCRIGRRPETCDY